MIVNKKLLLEAIELEKERLNSDYVITISDKEKLDNLLMKYGVSPEELPLDEKVSLEPDLTRTFSTPKHGSITITIPKSQTKQFATEIIEYTKRMGEDINDIKNWYLNAHNFIKSQLGDDAPLFIMILGVTSKSRSVIANLVAAKTIYYRLKKELINNKEQVIKFVHDDNLNFGTGSRVDDTEYSDLSFLQITKDLSGLFPDFKNINKILKLYFAKNEKISFDDAIEWMKSFFKVAGISKLGTKVLDKDNSISGHKLFNYTMNLLDPTNEKTPEYHFVTIDRHIIKYFIPETVDESKSEYILNKIFANTNGFYYALSLLISDITKEVQKTFPELKPNQIQAIVWFIARERYSDFADNTDGGTYEREFNNLIKLVETEKRVLDESKKYLTFDNVSKYVSNNFSKALNIKQHINKGGEEEVPF